MKRFLISLFLLMLMIPAANAEFSGRVQEELPVLNITVTEAGTLDDTDDALYVLTANVAAVDGSLLQAVTWHSNETPAFERAAALVALVDYNFDGYRDLQLLSSLGARNAFYHVALWNPEQGRFDPLLMLGAEPLTLCNPTFDGQRQAILSVEEDGFRYRTMAVIGWDTPCAPVLRVLAEVYDAGAECIGERLTVCNPEPAVLWDQVYAEGWYYGNGEGGAYDDRAEALDLFLTGDAAPIVMKVAQAGGAVLRRMDSESSEALAQLPAGAEVRLLKRDCGADGSWALVWAATDMTGESGALGMTGYVPQGAIAAN